MKSSSCKSFKLFMFVAACFILSMFYGCSNFFQDVMDNVSDIEVDYKVEHWKQALDGKSYELDAQETQILQGISLAKTQAQAKEFEGFTSKKIDQQKIKRDGTTVVKLYYNRKSVTYIFKAEGGNWNEDSADQTKTGLYGAALDIPENPVKTGYTFSKWSSDVPETFGASDITFVAAWLPGTGTLYKVEYYLQNMDGSDYERIDDDCQNLVGTTGELTVATAKEYEGFTVEDITQKEIAPDGSTVVPVYYTRNSISYIFTANGGNWNGSSDNKTVSGLYECSVTAPGAPVKTGYVFGGWSEEVPESFGTEAKSFSAVWLASTDTVYKVEHWQQNIDNNEYTKVTADTQLLAGTTLTQTKAQAKTYPGFTVQSFNQGVIEPDGSTVIRINYNRNTVTYTFDSTSGAWENNETQKTIKGKYGASVIAPENPTQTGYLFDSWDNEVPSTFGLSGASFTAEWNADPNTEYKVIHWVQNINDDEYTKTSEILHGTTNTQTMAVAYNDPGLIVKNFNQDTIAADGSTQINIYYDRKEITYTFNSERGKFSDDSKEKTISGRYGGSFTVPDTPTHPSYFSNGWDNTIPETFGVEDITFTAQYNYNFYEKPVRLPNGTEGSNGTRGVYVHFGVWPKSIKDENVEVDETKQMIMGGHTYYLGDDGEYYIKTLLHLYGGGSYKGFQTGQESYFKLEPIKWRALDRIYEQNKCSVLLFVDNTIIADLPFYGYRAQYSTGNSLGESPTRVLNNQTIYPNDYVYSNVRAYLNGIPNQFITDGGNFNKKYDIDWTGIGFLQTAFTANSQNRILETKLKDLNQIIYDKVFLFSEKEVNQFFGSYDSENKQRYRMGTEYASANYACQGLSTMYGVWWWLRTGSSKNGNPIYAGNIEGNGQYKYGNNVNKRDAGIVPGLWVELSLQEDEPIFY